ncbi:hypothetical protein B0T26DRAFT_675641 [Lasiosphaeria miniovina]|uniref:chitinase n=1 Tax=Lasiosphaeria miniovina TaxID=1954250 RepID=A0AA40AK25_9PEZI|nr:uncharacterized protein B0T26DRAFT_675641 [Lasiosphaeria miniovina]KAK0717316.1 hypothetical protein B0T26DRAFT_675641 [Lasiosphaeria miniovina]
MANNQNQPSLGALKVRECDLFLLEQWNADAAVPPDQQMTEIFDRFLQLSVAERHVGPPLISGGAGSRPLVGQQFATGRQEILAHARPFKERNVRGAIWLRTYYGPGSDSAMANFLSGVIDGPSEVDDALLYSDPVLYNFVPDWDRIFRRIPQLLDVPHGDTYEAGRQEELRKGRSWQRSEKRDIEAGGGEWPEDATYLGVLSNSITLRVKWAQLSSSTRRGWGQMLRVANRGRRSWHGTRTMTTTKRGVLGNKPVSRGLLQPCDTMEPEAIPAGALTHINLAFIEFNDNWNLQDVGGDLVARVSKLKLTYPGLRVNVAIGGWNFNDLPTSTRQIFIQSVVSYLTKYGLDGIDIDWECPTAPDRGGKPDNTQNYVLLLSDMRDAFDANFDLPEMEKYISWFNVMSYDLHGMWDQLNKYTGRYLQGHTNLTRIDQGFQLLWRVGIDPAKCQFSAVGMAGDYSKTPGILYYAEIASTNRSINVATYYDPVSTVKVNVFNGNQWISYDDEKSWADKLAYLTGHCLSGLMIWAIDQDTGQYDALSGLLGAGVVANGLLQGGSLSDAQKTNLVNQFGAYTGQDCFRPGFYVGGTCPEGSFRYICCPTFSMPKNCQWNGAPIRSEVGCSGFCGADQFQLNIDTYVDATADEGPCYDGHRSLCCDNTEILNQCPWTGCRVRQSICPHVPPAPRCRPYVTTTATASCVLSPWATLQMSITLLCKGSAVRRMISPRTAPGRLTKAQPSQRICLPTICPATPDEETGSDIIWAYQDNYGNNDAELSPDEAYGDDPYGFVILDGPPGSVDATFHAAYTVARSFTEDNAPLGKRSLLTTNRTRIKTAFEYTSEVLYVFCNYPDSSPRCQKRFHDGAEDTIIKLPNHRMKIDYEFGAIKRDSGPVNMRIDFTNLLDYWEDVTDTPAKVRRELQDGQALSYRDWRHRVGRAKTSHERMRRRQADIMAGKTTHLEARDNGMEHETPRAKRCFGTFGSLGIILQKSILLYRAFVDCARTNAQLNIYLDAEASMDATYAYYYSGALGGLVPTATYAYFAMQPSVYLGLTAIGSARLEYRSPRVMLIPTLSYPGLAIKGLAAVGPTLDLYGQIVGVVQLSGTMQVGARYTFERAEMYWPDDGEAPAEVSGFCEPARHVLRPYQLQARDNCGIVRDSQVNNAGKSATVPGICRNMQNFFQARGLSNSGLSLTWDPVNANPRRSFACRVTNRNKHGSSYCFTDNVIYTTAVGLSTGVALVSCDEYPLASAEEGGGYFGTLANSVTAISTLCVPVWQQTLQDNCNGLMSGLSTNVAYLTTPQPRPTGSSGATAAPWGRLATYPGQIPQAAGISSAVYGPNAAGEYGGYGNVPAFSKCTVIFSGLAPAPNSKRDENGAEVEAEDEEIVGRFNGWGVKRVIIHEDAEDSIPAPGFVPDPSHLMAAEILRKDVKFVPEARGGSTPNGEISRLVGTSGTGAQGLPAVRELYRTASTPCGCWGAFDGFATGEAMEMFLTVRCFEIAAESGVSFYVRGNLDYGIKLSGYDSRYRCGHYDGKGRIGEWVRLQRAAAKTTDGGAGAGMKAALFTTGFWRLFQASGSNKGIIRMDYALLDEIHPARIRSRKI